MSDVERRARRGFATEKRTFRRSLEAFPVVAEAGGNLEFELETTSLENALISCFDAFP